MQLQVKLRKTAQNNVFRSKQTTTKVPPKIFRGLEVKENVRLMC